jgi:shikimate kinase
MPRLTLVGFRGTGKTTVASAVASRLGCDWQDADVAFERQAGLTVAEFFASHGEPAFRDRETELLSRLLATCDGVLATGGGVVVREANRRLLVERGRPIVWLDATSESVRRRLEADPSTAMRRPSLTGGDPFAEVERLLRDREPLYAEVADLRIDTSHISPQEVVDRIAAWIGSRPLAPGSDP